MDATQRQDRLEDVLALLRRGHWSFHSKGLRGSNACVLCNEPYPCRTTLGLAVAEAGRAHLTAMALDGDREETARQALVAALDALDEAGRRMAERP